MIMIKQ